MNKQEQKLKVLKMLEEGTINQSEALDLLELIGAEKEKEQEKEITIPREPIRVTIPEAPLDFFTNGHQSFSVSAEVHAESIQSLKLLGKNSKVSLRTHTGNNIEIEGWYKAVRNGDPMIKFEENDGNFVLNYNVHGVKYLGFDVWVPEVVMMNLYLENSNATVDVSGVIAKRMTTLTKNAHINLSQCQSDNLVAVTKNAHIDMRQVVATKCELSTTNAKINVKNVKAEVGEFVTTNAEIALHDSQITKCNLQTKNAKIWLDLASLNLMNEQTQFEVEGKTTNANIDIFLPEMMELPFKMNASTKRGCIYTDSIDLKVSARDKGYLNAKTESYDYSAVTLDMNLQTTNANINVKGE